MLSNACQYAIRSILYLAINTNEYNKIGVKRISKELETPQPFLAKLLQQLAKSKLVSSVKGPNGGFYLDEKNRKNALWDIVKCIDGTEKFDQCFLGLAICGDENPCQLHRAIRSPNQTHPNRKDSRWYHSRSRNRSRCSPLIPSE